MPEAKVVRLVIHLSGITETLKVYIVCLGIRKTHSTAENDIKVKPFQRNHNTSRTILEFHKQSSVLKCYNTVTLDFQTF